MRRMRLKALVASSGALVGALASTEAAASCPAQFPGPGFGHQIAITVANPAAARGDTFVLATVNTQASIAAGKMLANGGDIRIATSDCSVVPFWIESGLNTPATKIWMRMPSVAAGDQQVDLYSGTPGASSVSSLDAVFGPALLSLYTFSETTGPSVGDRAGANAMTLAGSSWTTGALPSVGAVTGFASGRLSAGSGGPTLGNDFTVLSLIRPTSVVGTTAGIFGNYKDDQTSGWSLKLQGSTAGQFMLLTNQNGSWCQESGGSLVPNAWQFIGARRQYGSTNANTLFQDGAAVKSLCPGDLRDVNGPGTFEIGRQYNGTVPFPGDISITMLFGRALGDAEVAKLDAALRIANPPKVSMVGAVPAAPTIGKVTPGGTTGSVAFTPPADVGDGPITRFDVTCSPGGQASGTSAPVVVSGLTAGQSHSCSVRAANSFGVGPWSAPSNAFVPGGAPSFGSPSVASFVVRTTGAFTIITAGQPGPTLSLSGALPPGLVYADGVIQGTPAPGSVGSYPLTLTATNGVLPNATQTLLLEVTKASQSITFGNLANQVLGPQKVLIAATSTADLSVQLSSTTPTVCTLSGGQLSLEAVGVCTISATQPGNADFAEALPVTRSFQISLVAPPETDASVSKPDASISTTPDASRPPPTIIPPQETPDSLADAIEGGGCQCDATGASGSAGGLLLGGLGFVFGLTRRLRRPRR